MDQQPLLPAPALGEHVAWLKRPLSPGEVTNILKGFLQCGDQNLSSHSLKATTLSWAAKCELPREQRRILGRHAATVQGADTFYSRDMSIGPVNSLQKVITLIRDGVFHPDASRANYFPGPRPSASGTPAHVVMQPFTPAFIERAQPTTPGCDPVVPECKTVQSNVGDTVGRPQVDEVKSETGWNLLVNEGNVPVIVISPDSDSDSSESNTCSSTSSQGDSIDLDAEDAVETQRDAVDTAVNLDVWAKNVKTKIVHKCRNEVSFHVGDQQVFDEVFGGSLTCCGRDITKSYHLVVGPCDWTAKCRICFKGKRAP